MKRLFILLALITLAACTGTQGDHDPVVLVVATTAGSTPQLQLIETRNLSMSDEALVLHNDFTYTYDAGDRIVQLLVPDAQRRELWVLYTSSDGNMFIDIFTMSEVSLAQPAPLQPTAKIPLGAGTPVGFDVSGNEIAVLSAGDLLVFNRSAVTAPPKLITTLNRPFAIAPVYLDGRLHYWSEEGGNAVGLTTAEGNPKTISFGTNSTGGPVVTRDIFERDRIVHLGSNNEITLYDRSLNEQPNRVKLNDLQAPQSAHLYGGRLLSVAGALQQVALTTTGDELAAKLVGKDNIAGAIVVPDPYNQYAYALRTGSGAVITTLVDPQSEPDDEHTIRRNIQLSGLDTPTAGEAFIVQGAP